MKVIAKLLSDFKQNNSYKILVILFVLSSMLYLLGSISTAFSGIAFMLQVIFGIWITILSIKNKLTIWPILIIGLLFFIIGLSISRTSGESLTLAKEHFEKKQYFQAREYLNEIGDELTSSKDYIELKKNIDNKITETINSAVIKAKNELSRNLLNESKETLNNILKYDNENKEANSLLAIIQQKEQRLAEEIITNKNKDNISKLVNSINEFISKKEFSKAKQLISDFMNENSEFTNENRLISYLQQKISYAENLNIINDKYSNALKHYNKKEYSECVSNLKEVLELNNNHRESRALLLKAEKALQIENEQFWNTIKTITVIIVIIAIVIIFSGVNAGCPSCGKWWAREYINEVITSKVPFYKTITRKDVTKNRSGKIISTTERDIQVHMIKEIINTHYKCKYCSHKWKVESEKEYEG